jgi:AbrB family looped-hinge helix DNA binding protein
MMNTTERLDHEVEFSGVPVSSQGQVTIPKLVREHLGVKPGGQGRVNFLIRIDGTVIVEPVPTVDELFGILKPKTTIKPANIYEVREDIVNERLRELGYSPQNG